jgi:hypothetical protein
MEKQSNYVDIVLVILLGVFVQVLLISAGERETPSRSAVKFSKAYFALDPSMASWLCSEIVEDEDFNPVADHINTTADHAQLVGHEPYYMRMQLYGIETELISRDEDTAVVHLRGKRKRLINPLFYFIGKIFFLGETYHVDATLDLVKEEGQWKVCGAPYALPI